MRFRVRNAFYLRLSAHDVIPLYLYLDERHVDWMSERTLKSVVSDLKPLSNPPFDNTNSHALTALPFRIGPKLEAERYAHYGPGGPASAKKGTVEVHRGDTYQFAYFLRRAEPHSIMLKTRNYTLVNRPVKSDGDPSEEQGNRSHDRSISDAQADSSIKGKKRPRKSVTQRKLEAKGKGKAKAVNVIDDSEEEAEESLLSELDYSTGQDESTSTAPRRSVRNKKQRTVYREISDDDGDGPDNNDVLEGDVNMQAENELGVQVKQEVTDDVVLRGGEDVAEEESDPEPALPPDFGMDEDEEEKKSKPQLQLSFCSLNMRDRCLCVVVEPWPAPASAQRATPFPEKMPTSRAASVVPSGQTTMPSRAHSVIASRFVTDPEIESGRRRTPLPLFLPDPTGLGRSATPAPGYFPSLVSSLETIDDTQERIENDDEFGMLAFSQALNTISGDRVGAAEDDDEMDGGALYGDADEMRGALL